MPPAATGDSLGPHPNPARARRPHRLVAEEAAAHAGGGRRRRERRRARHGVDVQLQPAPRGQRAPARVGAGRRRRLRLARQHPAYGSALPRPRPDHISSTSWGGALEQTTRFRSSSVCPRHPPLAPHARGK